MIKATLKGMKLKMVEGVEMPESIYNKETKKWDKTGRVEEHLKYTFLDALTKEKLTFSIAKAKTDYSSFEDQEVDIEVSLGFDSFKNTNLPPKLVAVNLAKTK